MTVRRAPSAAPAGRASMQSANANPGPTPHHPPMHVLQLDLTPILAVVCGAAAIIVGFRLARVHAVRHVEKRTVEVLRQGLVDDTAEVNSAPGHLPPRRRREQT